MSNRPDLKAEMDWKDLREKPEKLFGYSYLYFLGFIVLVGYLYISNLTPLGKNITAPVVLEDSTAFAQDIPLQGARVLPPVDVLKAGVSRPESVSKGKEMYEIHCASCHGSNGEGNGPSGGLMNPRPRNFHDLSGWKNGKKVSEIYVTLEEGLIKTGMPSFNYLPPADRFAIIHMVRSFSAGLPDDTPDDLKFLDARYKLSEGVSIPGQIPVKKAMEILVRENKTRTDRVSGRKEIFRGNRLVSDAVFDIERVKRVFLNGGMRMKNLREFIAGITADPVGAGFHPRVRRLSADEWSELHKNIMSLIK